MLLLTGLAACQEPQVLPEKRKVLVRAQKVELVDFSPTLKLTGEIRARVQTDLSFRVSGRVVERNVEVGAHVTPDEVLARLEPEEQQANIASAEADASAAEAQLRQATSAFERQKSLQTRGFTTRREYDQAQEALRTAEGTLIAARALLASARDQLVQTVLRAGVAGIITNRQVEVGQVVQAAQAVFSIAHDGPRDAVFSVHEGAFTEEAVDDTVQISAVSDPLVTTTGFVREVAPTVDTATGTVLVKIAIEAPSPGMTLGSAVIGEWRFRPRKVIILPWSALSSLDGQPAVWLIHPETSSVSLRSIDVARFRTHDVIVSDGLRSGEMVVTTGAQLLRPNQSVALVGGTR